MDQDEWFDEDEDQFEIPSAEGKAKRAVKRRRPLADDWEEDEVVWDDWDDDFTAHKH